METRDCDSWLGKKFDEDDDPFDGRFAHDIPLQRSISLDRGIDISNHLMTIGSEWGSVGSDWTIDSDRDTPMDYRSFEDLPASPFRVKSRRASSDMGHAFSERNLALTVLKDSYKGLDSDRVSPQIRKLHRCFTYSGSFENFKQDPDKGEESVSDRKLRERLKAGLKINIPSDVSTSCPVSPQIQKLKRFQFRNAVETEESVDDDHGLELRVPFYRSISSVSLKKEAEPKLPQRRSGLQNIPFARREETNLRKGVLRKRVEFKSSELLLKRQRSRRGSLESCRSITTSDSNIDSESGNMLRLKRTLPIGTSVPTIVISDVVANTDNSSDYVEIGNVGTKCDCRICNEPVVDDGSYLRKLLSKLFVKIVSCRDFGRKLYWDENNNLNESEMYYCIMNCLKLLLGLWLRHLDHSV